MYSRVRHSESDCICPLIHIHTYIHNVHIHIRTLGASWLLAQWKIPKARLHSGWTGPVASGAKESSCVKVKRETGDDRGVYLVMARLCLPAPVAMARWTFLPFIIARSALPRTKQRITLDGCTHFHDVIGFVHICIGLAKFHKIDWLCPTPITEVNPGFIEFLHSEIPSRKFHYDARHTAKCKENEESSRKEL